MAFLVGSKGKKITVLRLSQNLLHYWSLIIILFKVFLIYRDSVAVFCSTSQLSNQEHSLGAVSPPPAEMQSVYFAPPAEQVIQDIRFGESCSSSEMQSFFFPQFQRTGLSRTVVGGVESHPCTEMQSVNSAGPGDWDF